MLKTTLFEFVVRASVDGQAVINVFHLRLTDTIDQSNYDGLDWTNVMGEWKNRWREAVLPRLHPNYVVEQYYGVEILERWPLEAGETRHRLRYGEEYIIEGSLVSDIGGHVSEEGCLPAYAAVSVMAKGNSRSRYSRGGKRFSGIPKEATNNDTLINGEEVPWQSGMNSLIVPYTIPGAGGLGQVKWAVFSHTLATTAPSASVFINQYAYPVVLCDVWNFISTQNSRKHRLGAS